MAKRKSMKEAQQLVAEQIIVKAVYPGQKASKLRKEIQAEFPSLTLGVGICSWSRAEFGDIKDTVDFAAAREQVDMERAKAIYFVYPDRIPSPGGRPAPPPDRDKENEKMSVNDYFTENLFYDCVQELQEIVQLARKVDAPHGIVVEDRGASAANDALRCILQNINEERAAMQDILA